MTCFPLTLFDLVDVGRASPEISPGDFNVFSAVREGEVFLVDLKKSIIEGELGLCGRADLSFCSLLFAFRRGEEGADAFSTTGVFPSDAFGLIT